MWRDELDTLECVHSGVAVGVHDIAYVMALRNKLRGIVAASLEWVFRVLRFLGSQVRFRILRFLGSQVRFRRRIPIPRGLNPCTVADVCTEACPR